MLGVLGFGGLGFSVWGCIGWFRTKFRLESFFVFAYGFGLKSLRVCFGL